MRKAILDLQALIDSLPRYVNDENEELYILTFQPISMVDSNSKATEVWVARYMRVTEEILWIHRNTGDTLYLAARNLKSELSESKVHSR